MTCIMKYLVYELFSGVGLCNQLFSLETAVYLSNISKRKLIILIKNPLCNCGKSSWEFGNLIAFFENNFLDYLPYGLEICHSSVPLKLKQILENKDKTQKMNYKSRFSNLVFVDKKLETKENSKLTLTLALSYGSRNEIINVIREISDKVKNNIISSKNIDETVINDHLYTRNLPDVDLLIRTSGEKRISNFLLWQIAYSELYFTKKLWPDFRKKDLYKAIVSYQNRERRFGKTSEQIK